MRKNGYYWIKWEPKISDSWDVAQWDGMRWWLTGYEEGVEDDEIHEVGPRIKEPINWEWI